MADKPFLCSCFVLHTTLLWEIFSCLSTKPSLSSSEPFTSTTSSDVSLKTKKEKEKEINEETREEMRCNSNV